MSGELNVTISHVASSKHNTGKESVLCKEVKERDIAQALPLHDKSVHPVGEILPKEQRMYHVKVLKPSCMLLYPLLKWKYFESCSRKMHVVFPIVDTLSGLVPFIILQEQEDLKQEISGCPVALIFDGLGIRFVAEDFVIHPSA